MKVRPHGIDTAPPGAAVARLFIALWLPPALAAALHARGAQACADTPARREAPGRLHLTLHFLGAVPRDRLPALQAALCLPFSPFELRFDACTRWSSGVVVAEPLSTPPALLALHAALAQVLATLGLRTEVRAFRPHVTLARRHAGPWPAAPFAGAPLRWRISRYALVESMPGPPAHYRVLMRCGAQAAGIAQGLAQPQCPTASAGVSLRHEHIGEAQAVNETAAPGAVEAQADNALVAQALREMAVLLEAQGDNPFRVAAYRRAADTVARLAQPLREIHRLDGLAGLDALPGVGPRIAAAIAELLDTGRWQQLERLRGSADPQALFRTIPGVGAELAHRLHDELGVDTLEALENAAHGGRLEGLAGIGPRRAAALRAALTDMLDRRRRLRSGAAPRSAGPEPPVDMLLDVDHAYRTRAEAGRLPTIAPRRFNPDGSAWLPVLHTERPGWHFTALYSNTARAHELGRVHDWVVIYAEDDAHHEHGYTVVTATRGLQVGQRVVRGREAECQAWRQAQGPA